LQSQSWNGSEAEADRHTSSLPAPPISTRLAAAGR
jgi:hypothetical protein